jgi:hypothetical protein
MEQLLSRIEKEIRQKEQMLALSNKHKTYYDGALASLRYIRYFVKQLLEQS